MAVEADGRRPRMRLEWKVTPFDTIHLSRFSFRFLLWIFLICISKSCCAVKSLNLESLKTSRHSSWIHSIHLVVERTENNVSHRRRGYLIPLLKSLPGEKKSQVLKQLAFVWMWWKRGVLGKIRCFENVVSEVIAIRK